MTATRILTAVLGLAMVIAPMLALGEPISFPTDETPPRYVEDFEEFLGVEWTLENWLQELIPPLGVATMSGSGGGNGLVAPANPSGLDDLNFGGAVFPLLPTVAPDGYGSFGFSGSWLITQGVGNAVEEPPGSGAWVQQGAGSALVEFKDLPAHQSVDVFLKLAAADSFDTGQNVNLDGPFEVLIDGTSMLSHQFTSGGASFIGREGVGTLANRQNLTGNYREQWNENAGAGPADADDRFGVNWTLDSGFELGAMPELTAVPHTADTLTVEFIHRTSGAPTDEFLAIEDLRIVLNEGTTSSNLNWPAKQTVVTDDFESGGLPNWTFEVVENFPGGATVPGAWSVVSVPAGGAADMTMTGNANGQIRPSSGGLDDAVFGGAVFPVTPLVAPDDYGTLTGGAISGNWLQQIGVGPATESIPASGTFDITNDGIARLAFANLPSHTGLDLDLVIAAGGSWDGGTTNQNHDGEFDIRVDGVSLWAHFFGNGGATLDGSPGVATFFTNANANDHYREQWNDNAGAGPAEEDDRFFLNWTMDSAYDLGGLTELTEIPHTANTLTVEFIHRLNSNFTDEQVALENVTVSLLGVPTKGIEIVNIAFVVGEVTLEWTSDEGLTYIMERSFDLMTWTQVGDPIIGDAETTEGFDSTLPPDTEEAFYRVLRL